MQNLIGKEMLERHLLELGYVRVTYMNISPAKRIWWFQNIEGEKLMGISVQKWNDRMEEETIKIISREGGR